MPGCTHRFTTGAQPQINQRTCSYKKDTYIARILECSRTTNHLNTTSKTNNVIVTAMVPPGLVPVQSIVSKPHASSQRYRHSHIHTCMHTHRHTCIHEHKSLQLRNTHSKYLQTCTASRDCNVHMVAGDFNT